MARTRGPRPQDDTRGMIIASARKHFSQHGYVGTSLRAVARDAGVDPALVHHYFDDRSALYAAAVGGSPVGQPQDLAQQLQQLPHDRHGEHLVCHYLALWEDDESRERLMMLYRSAQSEPGIEASDRYQTNHVLTDVLQRLGADQPRLRAELISSVLVGIAGNRNLIGTDGLQSLSIDDLVALMGPIVQRLLDEPLSSETPITLKAVPSPDC